MEKLLIFFLFYFVIIFSIIGYGNIFSLVSNRSYSIGEKGLNGILFLIIISYITNFFSPHSAYHNVIVIIFGLLTGLAMFIALLAVLTLLPKLIIFFKPFENKK